MIVHCTSGPNVGRAVSITDPVKAHAEREAWEKAGNVVEVREVDNSRDWNDRSDPVVRQEEQDEREAQEGRWDTA